MWILIVSFSYNVCVMILLRILSRIITETSYLKPTIKTFILNYKYREPSTKDLTLLPSIIKGVWSGIYPDISLWSGRYLREMISPWAKYSSEMQCLANIRSYLCSVMLQEQWTLKPADVSIKLNRETFHRIIKGFPLKCWLCCIRYIYTVARN